MTHAPPEEAGRLAVSAGERASPGDLDEPLDLREGWVAIKEDGVAGGRVAGGSGDAGRRIPPLFDGSKECRERVLAFPDDDVVGILRHLTVAGGSVGPSDNRYAVGSRDLVAVETFVDGVQTVAGDVGKWSVGDLEVVSVTLAGRGEDGQGVVRRGYGSPVDVHGCKKDPRLLSRRENGTGQERSRC
jgi:hypothetical protein